MSEFSPIAVVLAPIAPALVLNILKFSSCDDEIVGDGSFSDFGLSESTSCSVACELLRRSGVDESFPAAATASPVVIIAVVL